MKTSNHYRRGLRDSMRAIAGSFGDTHPPHVFVYHDNASAMLDDIDAMEALLREAIAGGFNVAPGLGERIAALLTPEGIDG